jgi:hypothetical protein
MSQTHKGSCFCGAVQFEVFGEPAAMGYCHCSDCRQWSAGPINAFSLWPPGNVKVTQGADHIDSYAKTDKSHRKWCKKCGGHIFSEHPGMGLTDVYAALLPTLDFKPMMHVFYGEKMVSVKDGLRKLKDVPAEMGGSGETLPE